MHGYRINLSSSLPYWIFKVHDASDKLISRGDFVIIDYSLITDNHAIKAAIDRKYLGQRPMGKQIGAVPGDLVVLRDSRIYINEEDKGCMKILSEDSLGNPLYPFPTPVTLQYGQYWLISNPERGFDSRYFGFVHRSCIVYLAYPVL